MLRGVAKQQIFVDDHDRYRFLAFLDQVLCQTDTICFAWALMGNHVHLALKTGRDRLGAAMARLNTRYAMHFNTRHGRVGHLFQNRYRNRLACDEADLIGLVRYIHGNPLKDGIIGTAQELERYPWTGHGAVIGTRDAERFHAADRTRTLFDGDPSRAVLRVRRLMRDYESTLRAAAVGSAWTGLEESPDLISSICQLLGVDETVLQRGQRTARASATRAVIVHLGENAGVSRDELARRTGISKQAIEQARVRGKALVESSTPEDLPWESSEPREQAAGALSVKLKGLSL
jgi:REP element-mobilizing transposase RayT